MKTAICISGQPRGIPLSCEKIKWGILDKNPNADIFFHTWFNPERVGERFFGAQPSQANKIGKEQPDTKEILLKAYNPLKYIIEPQRDFSRARGLRQAPTAVQEHLMSMFYSIWKANELKREYEKAHGFIYDCVVRLRFDLVFDQQICFKDYAEYLDEYLITSKKFQDEREDHRFIHGEYTMTDIFVFSSSENMDKFSGVYPEYEFINSQIYPPFGENTLGYHCKVTHGLKVKTIPVTYEIMHRIINLDDIK